MIAYESLQPDSKNALRKDLENDAIQARGHILERTTDLEASMSLYITLSFTKDMKKAEELNNLIVMPRMTFEQKYQAFIFLVEKYNPQFLIEHPKAADEITKIISERNIFAHYPLAIHDSYIKEYYEKKTVTFLKFINSKVASKEGQKKETRLTNTVTYNNEKVTEILNNIYDYRDWINKILSS